MLAVIYGRWIHEPERAAHYRAQSGIARRRLREFKAGLIPPSDDRAEEAEIRSPEGDELPALDNDCSSLEGVPEEEIVTIVTGLPRSGTSLMMQVLEAGGLEVLTDGKRGADLSNPKGYYEYERATALQRDQGWLPKARGRVVKIVAQLLPFLPERDCEDRPYHYRVVFMERALDEVVASQRKMLEREQRQGEGATIDLRQAYRSQLANVRRFLRARGIPAQGICFSDAIADADGIGRTLRTFLGGHWEGGKAAEVVDPALYRERVAEGA